MYTFLRYLFDLKAYSLDLRERVAAACAEPAAKIYEVAARFAVSLSFANKLLRRQRTNGSLAALPARGGPPPPLDPAGQEQLRACLAAQPDATLDELRTLLAGVGGPALSRSATWRSVEELGWGRKKKASTPPNVAPSASGSCAGNFRQLFSRRALPSSYSSMRPAPTSRIAAATAGPRLGNACPRPCRCTAGPT